MLSNRHDIWQAFCETHRVLIAQAELPSAVIRSRQRFRDLLSEGEAVVSEARISLGELNPPQWAALSQLAAAFFREFESFVPEDRFTAFRNEAQRRGDKFPH